MKKITATLTAAGAIAGAAITGVVMYSDTETTDTATDTEITLPTVSIPTVSIPTVSLPSVDEPEIETPELKLPTLTLSRELASVEIAELNLPEIEDLNVKEPTVAVSGVKTPELKLPDTAEAERIYKQMKTLFRDQRSISYEVSSNYNADTLKKWLEIYQSAEYQDYVPEYKTLEPGLRIICEVRCPENAEQFRTLQERLDYYIARKYNAVLVTFTTTESLSKLLYVMDYIKSLGLKTIIAYAGKENLYEPVFRDPDTLARWLAATGEKADALLIGWGRTSTHLLLHDTQFTNFIIKNARAKNSDLPFIGEAYYGQTAEIRRGATYHVPPNCSAVLIIGTGYSGSSNARAMKTLFPEVLEHVHKIGMVTGERPYYDTRHNTGRTKHANDQIKRRIELRLMKIGCGSTMTRSGDGSDGIYDKNLTENLCLTYKEEVSRK